MLVIYQCQCNKSVSIIRAFEQNLSDHDSLDEDLKIFIQC
jgi:hypothetical protein